MPEPEETDGGLPESASKPTESDLMTREEAADFLRLTLRGLEDKMRARELPYYKIGRVVRFRRSTLERYLEERCLVKAMV